MVLYYGGNMEFLFSSGKSWTPLTLGITGFTGGDRECFSLSCLFPPYYLK